MMSAYSAVSLGHGHPRSSRALTEQAQRLAVTSRAFHTDRLPPVPRSGCAALTGMDRALPMNTGAEAVETALKAARKWAYKVKRVPEGRAEIIVCEGNFHGRTTTIIGFPPEAQYRDGFGPFPRGLQLRAVRRRRRRSRRAITPAHRRVPGRADPGRGAASSCRRRATSPRARASAASGTSCSSADEVQTGLGRTGKLLACDHDGVQPDGLVLGKALGGGLLPVSAFLARDEVMEVFTPGDHGSTFGGNPLAAAVALEALDVIVDERLAERAAALGARLLTGLASIRSPLVREVRGQGLLIGVEIDPRYATARLVVDRLLAHGILSKDTHGTVVRFAPPLVISREEIDWAVAETRKVLEEIEREVKRAA